MTATMAQSYKQTQLVCAWETIRSDVLQALTYSLYAANSVAGLNDIAIQQNKKLAKTEFRAFTWLQKDFIARAQALC